MKFQRYIVAVLTLLAAATLQSCEKDVANFDLSTTPMLVTTAFISPQDTVLTVELRRTQPAIGKQLSEEGLKVPDATVTLSDGSQTVELTYNPVRDRYYASIQALPVIAGKKYFLKVATPVGEKAEGACTVPMRDGIQITELNYETIPVNNYGYQMTKHKINYKWQDAPGVENYYHATSYRHYYATYGYPPVREAQYEPAYAENSKIYLSDTKQDGAIMHSPEFSFTSVDPDLAPKPYGVIAVLAVTDKAYHQYHKSVSEQETNGGNPFAEPKLIYSNMQGSLGVFAAYNQIKAVKIIQ